MAMDGEFGPATPRRRFVAVWIDLWTFFVLWTGAGLYLSADTAFYPALAFFVINTLLTAFTGVSLGRALTGIRVERAPNGGAIGLPRAFLRALIVLATGWMLVFAFIAEDSLGNQPRRMWWDRAAGSRLVLARRSSNFWNWSFSGVEGPALLVPLICLLSLEGGQGPSVWMLTGFAVLIASVVVSTYGKNTNRQRLAHAINLIATVAVLLLGVGVIVAAHQAEPVRHEVTIEWAYTNSTRYSGTRYVLTASDGTTYFFGEADFHPTLPPLDSPSYRGREATLTLDAGTTSVLAIDIDGVNHVSATYTNPKLRLIKDRGLGGLVLGIGIAMAIVFTRLKRQLAALWPRRRGAPVVQVEPPVVQVEPPVGRDATWQSYE